jgi:choline-sulfatase
LSARVDTRLAVVALLAAAGSHVGAAPLVEEPAGKSVAPTSPGIPRVAIDLLTNRIHASSHREGHLVVEAGSPDLLKYVDGGWKTSFIFGEKDQGAPAALVSGLSGQLFLPIDTDGDGVGGTVLGASVLAFTLRAFGLMQKVSVFINEKSVGTIVVDAKKKRYQVAVPAAFLRTGENRLRFTFRTAAAVGSRRIAAALTDLTLGPAGGEPPPEPVGARVSAAILGGVARSAISIAGKGSRLSYYLQPPEGSALAFSYGCSVAGSHALVRVAVDGKPPKDLMDVAVGSGKWTDVSLPLGAAGGQAVRIDLVSRGGAVLWAEPRLLVTAPAPPKIPTEPFDHVFVWMVDTLRADKVRAYNPNTRVETPNYDAFAADSTRFEWAQVPGTWSLPSHASLLTGVYPTVHKATAHEAKVSKDVAFIAEDLKKIGFKTAIFSSNGYVSGKWGFQRGWDAYRNFIRENLPNGSDYLWKTGKAWVLQNQKRREFVYLATIEPHVAYTPKPEFLKKYWNKPYKGPLKPSLTGVQLGSIAAGKLKINDNDKAYLEALHDGEISQSDAVFATFISDLKAAKLYDRSVVIVVSDHGDEFGEHGRFGHGHSVYQELTHVPLMIRAPGRMPKGRLVHADVEIMDLYTTILDLVGGSAGKNIQGTSLIPLSWDEVGQSPRAALTMDGQVARGVKVARYRLVAASGRLELYDEFEDRLEQKNVASQRPIALRQMRGVMALLHAYESSWSKSRWGTAANGTRELAEDLGLR